ncbi:hypothetical protein YC2023_038500 [Brassica napus]
MIEFEEESSRSSEIAEQETKISEPLRTSQRRLTIKEEKGTRRETQESSRSSEIAEQETKISEPLRTSRGRLTIKKEEGTRRETHQTPDHYQIHSVDFRFYRRDIKNQQMKKKEADVRPVRHSSPGLDERIRQPKQTREQMKLKALNPEAKFENAKRRLQESHKQHEKERKDDTSTGNDPKSKKSPEPAVILNAELLVKKNTRRDAQHGTPTVPHRVSTAQILQPINNRPTRNRRNPSYPSETMLFFLAISAELSILWKRKSRARADGKTVADRLKQWKDHNEGENQQRRKVHAKGSKKRLYEGWDEQR